jgi:hypothetical protein
MNDFIGNTVGLKDLMPSLKKHLPKFASAFHIMGKTGSKRMPLRLNSTQKFFLNHLWYRNVWLKSRQVGATTLSTLMLLLAARLLEGAEIAVVSYNMDDAIRRLKRIELDYLKYMTPESGITSYTCSQNMIVFEPTGSMLIPASGVTDNPGRGGTFKFALCTEAAYWPRNSQAFSSIEETLPDLGMLIMESTPNGMNNLFYDRYISGKMVDEPDTNQYVSRFAPWFEHDEYEKKPPAKMKLTPEERELKLKYDLKDSQLYWRRTKLPGFPNYLESSYRAFMQNYPEDDQSCWVSSTFSPFKVDLITRLTVKQPELGRFGERYYERPQRGERYFMGVDPAQGKKRSTKMQKVESSPDDSAFCVINSRGEICCTYNDKVYHTVFTERVNEVQSYYNADCLVETTGGHGYYLLESIRTTFPYKEDKFMEFKNVHDERSRLFLRIADWLAVHTEVCDVNLQAQLQAYDVTNPDANVDDLLMSFGASLECLDRLSTRPFAIVSMQSNGEPDRRTRMIQDAGFYGGMNW